MNGVEIIPKIEQQNLETGPECFLPATDKVPLMDGYSVFVTKPQKVAILMEGRRMPQNMISKFLSTFFSEEELGRMSYSGKKENPAIPVHLRECLNGLLQKYHPEFVGVAKFVNRICCNARYRWRQKAGYTHPGNTSKFTPKQKRQSKARTVNDYQNEK